MSSGLSFGDLATALLMCMLMSIPIGTLGRGRIVDRLTFILVLIQYYYVSEGVSELVLFCLDEAYCVRWWR